MRCTSGGGALWCVVGGVVWFAGHPRCGALRCGERVARPPEARGRCASAGAVRGRRRSFLTRRCGCHGAECVVSKVVARPSRLLSPGRAGAGPGPEAEGPAHGGKPAGVHAAGPPRHSVLAVNHSQPLRPIWQTVRAEPGLAGACEDPWPKPLKVATFTGLHVASRAGLPLSKPETRVQ